MGAKQSDDNFSEQEARERMEAALKGARIVGHKPMSSMTPKRPKGKGAEKRTTGKGRARVGKSRQQG